MTENEAKTKWCPFSRTAVHHVRPEQTGWPSISVGISVVNRVLEEELPATLCRGSACMAWRDAGRELGEIVERVFAEPGSRIPDGEGWGYVQIEPGAPSKGGEWVRRELGALCGYCGLAGAQ